MRNCRRGCQGSLFTGEVSNGLFHVIQKQLLSVWLKRLKMILFSSVLQAAVEVLDVRVSNRIIMANESESRVI
jgi:cell division protein FtsL